MSHISNDHFSEVTSSITDEDRIKAGYKIPVKKFPIETSTTTDILRGDLKGVTVPIPMNFHEGGMFNSDDTDDTDESSSVHRRRYGPFVGNKGTNLVGRTHLDPFRHDVMVDGPNKKVDVKMNGESMTIERGPNNIYNKPGFYNATLNSDKFGKYPNDEKGIKYNPNDIDTKFKEDDKFKETKKTNEIRGCDYNISTINELIQIVKSNNDQIQQLTSTVKELKEQIKQITERQQNTEKQQSICCKVSGFIRKLCNFN